MGKPFNSELRQLKKTVQWADSQDVKSLQEFLYQKGASTSMVCIGSGGSSSACSFAAMLYKRRNGVLACAMTPLELMYSGREIIRDSKLLYLSASGKNKDILNAIKYGVKLNETEMMSLSLRKGNPTEQFLEDYPKVIRWCDEVPTGKDGFLATNSLIATFSLLSRAFDGEAVANAIDFKGTYKMTNAVRSLDKIENFVVLYGAAGEAVAKDIESKLSEAALGCALLTDFRNFGHGRHHWFDKRGENSCIVALVSPVEADLAEKTISCLPKDIPVIYIDTKLDLPKASIDMLVKAFRFVEDLGIARGIDPGRPGVPTYGRLLYNLNYYKLTNVILPTESTLEVSVKRKIGADGMRNEALKTHYQKECKRFVSSLNKTVFNTIAFDYDGTLSPSDHDSRWQEHLYPAIAAALLSLLEKGIELRIATGRGKSVGNAFRNSIDEKYWPQIQIGYYNGACLLPLADQAGLTKYKKNNLNAELQVLKDELQQRLPNSLVKYDITSRNQQISIEEVSSEHDSELLFATCREIVWDKKLSGIHVWRSSHSMDVVVFSEACKLSVIDNQSKTLCIGDYGSVEGNDYEMLTSKYSLSVDRVSKNAECCWNIAPSGMKGIDATLYYLSRLTITDGIIKCKFTL